MIDCPECGKQISSRAPTCPNCGAPIEGEVPTLKGGRVPYSDQEVAVMLSKKKKTNHILHLLLSIITAGIWIIVWILVAASNGSENRAIDKGIARGKKI